MATTKTKADDTQLGTCAACGREIAVDNKNALVHHGYQRPGDGIIHGDCFGVGSEAHEISPLLAEECLKMNRSLLLGATESLRKHKAGEVTTLAKVSYSSGKRVPVAVTAPSHEYDSALQSAIYAIEGEIRSFEREIARLETMVAFWKPGVLTSRAKREREAKDAAAAKKAEKAAAKAEKLAATVARKEKTIARQKEQIDAFVTKYATLLADAYSNAEGRVVSEKFVDDYWKLPVGVRNYGTRFSDTAGETTIHARFFEKAGYDLRRLGMADARWFSVDPIDGHYLFFRALRFGDE